MQTDQIDRLLAATRPTDADVDAEFPRAVREMIVDEIVQWRPDSSPAVTPLRTRRAGPRRWLTLVAAGVVVALVVLGLQTFAPGRQVAVVTPLPSGGSATTTLYQPPLGVPYAAALEPVAEAAEKQPLLMPTGTRFLHLVTSDAQTDTATVSHDMYVSSDGWIWRSDTVDGVVTFWMLYHPNVADYSALPADPAALEAALRAGTGSNSGDERVFKAIDDILTSRTAPPAIRAAAIRVLDRVAKSPQAPETTKNGEVASPEVTLETTTVSGVDAVRATLTDSGSRPGVSYSMVLDATTGDLIASDTVGPDLSGNQIIRTTTESTRELVDSLPTAFVQALGTARVHKEIQPR